MTAAFDLGDRSAVISPCQRYRYRLTRQVGPGSRAAAFIMLNPSTADYARDDPTVRKCVAFARLWQCGELIVVNLFAYRATDPKAMLRAEDPVGPENMGHVEWAALQANGSSGGEPRTGAARDFSRGPGGSSPGEPPGPVVCAWGAHGFHLDQDMKIMALLRALGVRPMCLGVTDGGHPKHPLYIGRDIELEPYKGRRWR